MKPYKKNISCVLLQSLVLSSRSIYLLDPQEDSSVTPMEIQASPLEALDFSSEQSQNTRVDPFYSQVTDLSESQERSLLVVFSVNLVQHYGPANAEGGRKCHQMSEIRGHHFVLFG